MARSLFMKLTNNHRIWYGHDVFVGPSEGLWVHAIIARLYFSPKTAENSEKTAAVPAVSSLAQSPEAQDFCGERDPARSKFPAKTAKTARNRNYGTTPPTQAGPYARGKLVRSGSGVSLCGAQRGVERLVEWIATPLAGKTAAAIVAFTLPFPSRGAGCRFDRLPHP
jgi:hypothetical protein